MVGDDGAGNQIGMAPNAQWIACRNMEQGWGTPATYAECYEWFIAPYPVGGDPMLDGDPAKAPHVINNSWGCPPAEGCNNPDILRTVVDNVRAAGIVTANSAGNSGPSCGTILDPAAIYDASFTVGATYANDTIAGFSSRGPTWVGNNDPAKPDISAPGVGIRSSVPGGSYGTSSGTSMAAPHVAGLVGLLLAARPDLVGNVDALEEVIKESALPLFSTDGCGGDKSDTVPNYTYGWGRIDALAAYRLAKPEPQYLIYTPIWIEQQTEYNED
jgi:subtilisin family serine protease